MSDVIETPHTAVWQPKRDATRGGPANDGKESSAQVEGGEIRCFIEPKTARWTMETYGVETERRPYLFMALPQDVQGMQMGDVLVWRGQPLRVQYAPTVYDIEDGLAHAETLLTGEKTGGRIV